MKKHLKMIVVILAVVILGLGITIPILASVTKAQPPAQTQDMAPQENAPEGAQGISDDALLVSAGLAVASDSEAQTKNSKAMAACIVVGVVAAVGAISMALAICKSSEGVARQPEAGGRIQTMLMLGLVFIETAIIYALIVAILIIFVL